MGYVGLVVNLHYVQVIDGMLGWFGIDIAGDDGRRLGLWPWQTDERAAETPAPARPTERPKEPPKERPTVRPVQPVKEQPNVRPMTDRGTQPPRPAPVRSPRGLERQAEETRLDTQP